MGMDIRLRPESPLPLANKLVLFLFFSLTLLGVATTAYILIQGHQVLALNDFVSWNIFVSAYMFFGLSASGICMINSFSHVFGIEKYEIITKRSIILSLILLGTGVFSMFMHVGRPLKMIYLFITPNFTAPIFWLIIIYTLYMTFLVLELYFHLVKNHKALAVVSRFILLYSVAATGALGAFFGILYARPLWYGASSLVYIIVSAFLSGLAFFIVATIFTYTITGKRMSQPLLKLIGELGSIQAVAIGGVIFITIAKLVTGLVSGDVEYLLLFTNELRLPFWVLEIFVGLALPFLILILGRRSTGKVVLSSFLVLIGLFAARYNIVIGGQLMNTMGINISYPNQFRLVGDLILGTYRPNLVEILFVVGLFGFVGFFYTLANSVFSLDKEEAED